MKQISFNDFQKVELCKGTIREMEAFPEARTPAYILTVDFGEKIGMKRSFAQITDFYSPEDLMGKQ